MKNIIRLTESDLVRIVKRVIKENIISKFIESEIPELNKLNRRSDFSSRIYGSNEIFYNKENKDYVFRYMHADRKLRWTPEGDIEHYNAPNTLWIETKTYRSIQNYIPTFDDELILKWFNQRYKKDAKELKVRNSLKVF